MDSYSEINFVYSQKDVLLAPKHDFYGLKVSKQVRWKIKPLLGGIFTEQ